MQSKVKLKATSLAEYINELVISPEKKRFDAITNLVDIYTQPFDMDLIESLFDLPETVVGSNDKGEIDWSNWKKVSDTLYCLSEDDTEDLIPAPIPNTVGDFIEDCNRIWNKDLVWDSNLVKRNFKI